MNPVPDRRDVHRAMVMNGPGVTDVRGSFATYAPGEYSVWPWRIGNRCLRASVTRRRPWPDAMETDGADGREAAVCTDGKKRHALDDRAMPSFRSVAEDGIQMARPI